MNSRYHDELHGELSGLTFTCADGASAVRALVQRVHSLATMPAEECELDAPDDCVGYAVSADTVSDAPTAAAALDGAAAALERVANVRLYRKMRTPQGTALVPWTTLRRR